MKVLSDIKPTKLVEVGQANNPNKRSCIFYDLSSIEEVETEHGIAYEYNAYITDLCLTEDKIIEQAEELYSLVKQAEIDRLSAEIREKRNQLLTESDKYMALDRLDLDTSTAIKFLASLKNIFNNDYAKYRQALRDITKQSGFPYDVEFPQKPE